PPCPPWHLLPDRLSRYGRQRARKRRSRSSHPPLPSPRRPRTACRPPLDGRVASRAGYSRYSAGAVDPDSRNAPERGPAPAGRPPPARGQSRASPAISSETWSLSSLFKKGGPDQREATHATFGSVRQCEIVVAWVRC